MNAIKQFALILLLLTTCLCQISRADGGANWSNVQTIPQQGNVEGGIAGIDQKIRAIMFEHHVPGISVAIAKNGKLLYSQGYGFADLTARDNTSPKTRFRIASVSKPFTAAAILKLVQDGKIGLNDKVVQLIADKPYQGKTVDERWNAITIQHLLHHTAGFNRSASYDPMFYDGHIASALGVTSPAGKKNIIRFMLAQRLDHAPGTKYAYSNFGYSLLGRVIENVSGKPYFDYIQEEILDPLSLRSVALGRTQLSDRQDGEARYHSTLSKLPSVFDDVKGMVDRPYGAWNLEAMDSHGGLIANAEDLLNFASGLGDESLLNSQYQTLLYAKPVGSDNSHYYANGWDVRPVGDKSNRWHTGVLDGTSALLVQRHDGFSWAVLANARYGKNASQQLVGILDTLMHEAVDSVTDWERKPIVQATPAIQQLKVSGRLFGLDDEYFKDEKGTKTFDFEIEVPRGGKNSKSKFAVVKVGGELRGEADLHLVSAPDGSTEATISMRLYEGVSENTNDLDGTGKLVFQVPPDASVTKKKKVKNQDEGGDHIDLAVTIQSTTQEVQVANEELATETEIELPVVSEASIENSTPTYVLVNVQKTASKSIESKPQVLLYRQDDDSRSFATTLSPVSEEELLELGPGTKENSPAKWDWYWAESTGPLPPGTYFAQASLSGVKPVDSGYQVVRPDHMSIFHISLQPQDQLGELSGIVSHRVGANARKPLSYWEVIATDQTKKSRKTVTDQAGHYELSLPEGIWWIHAQAGGGASDEVSRATSNPVRIEIVTGGQFDHDVTILDADETSDLAEQFAIVAVETDTQEGGGSGIPVVEFQTNSQDAVQTVPGSTVALTQSELEDLGDFSDQSSDKWSWFIATPKSALDEQSYIASASLNGYAAASSLPATVDKEGAVFFHLNLVKPKVTGDVTGQIVQFGSQGALIEDAEVRFWSEQHGDQEVISEDGKFVFDQLRAGVWWATASADGFEVNKAMPINVAAGEKTNVKIELSPVIPEALTTSVIAVLAVPEEDHAGDRPEVQFLPRSGSTQSLQVPADVERLAIDDMRALVPDKRVHESWTYYVARPQTDLEPGDYSAIASLKGFRSAASEPQEAVLGFDTVLSIDFEKLDDQAEFVTVFGRIFGQTNAGELTGLVPDAQVEFLKDGIVVASASTSQNGYYWIGDIPVGEVGYRIRADGYASEDYGNRINLPASEKPHVLDFHLTDISAQSTEEATLDDEGPSPTNQSNADLAVGVWTSVQGHPNRVANAILTLRKENGTEDEQIVVPVPSGADYRYSATPGTWWISASATGFADSIETHFVVEPGDKVQKKITLARSVGEVRVLVNVQGETEDPSSQPTVVLYSESGEKEIAGVVSSVTDEELESIGASSIQDDAGNSWYWAQFDQEISQGNYYATASFPGFNSAQSSVQSLLPEESTIFHVTLKKEKGSLVSGGVYESPNKTAIADATVEFENMQTKERFLAKTGLQGQYSIELSKGIWWSDAFAPGFNSPGPKLIKVEGDKPLTKDFLLGRDIEPSTLAVAYIAVNKKADQTTTAPKVSFTNLEFLIFDGKVVKFTDQDYTRLAIAKSPRIDWYKTKVKVPPVDTTAEAKLTGYVTQRSDWKTIKKGSTTDYYFRLKQIGTHKTGQLQVVVLDENQQPVDGAKVQIKRGSEPSQNKVAWNGLYGPEKFATGEYTVAAHATGFESSLPRSVSITKDELTRVMILLNKTPPPPPSTNAIAKITVNDESGCGAPEPKVYFVREDEGDGLQLVNKQQLSGERVVENPHDGHRHDEYGRCLTDEVDFLEKWKTGWRPGIQESPNGFRLTYDPSTTWPKDPDGKTRLKVKFVGDGDDDDQKFVRETAEKWESHAHIDFQFVDFDSVVKDIPVEEYDITVAIQTPKKGSGGHSSLGARSRFNARKGEASMVLGKAEIQNRDKDSNGDGKIDKNDWHKRSAESLVLHEFGHALGLPHEHQRFDTTWEYDFKLFKATFDIWDEKKIESEFKKNPEGLSFEEYKKKKLEDEWTEEKVLANFNTNRKRIEEWRNKPLTGYDADSIMHYPIDTNFVDPKQLSSLLPLISIASDNRSWGVLSPEDVAGIGKLYPKPESPSFTSESQLTDLSTDISGSKEVVDIRNTSGEELFLSTYRFDPQAQAWQFFSTRISPGQMKSYTADTWFYIRSLGEKNYTSIELNDSSMTGTSYGWRNIISKAFSIPRKDKERASLEESLFSNSDYRRVYYAKLVPSTYEINNKKLNPVSSVDAPQQLIELKGAMHVREDTPFTKKRDGKRDISTIVKLKPGQRSPTYSRIAIPSKGKSVRGELSFYIDCLADGSAKAVFTISMFNNSNPYDVQKRTGRVDSRDYELTVDVGQTKRNPKGYDARYRGPKRKTFRWMHSAWLGFSISNTTVQTISGALPTLAWASQTVSINSPKVAALERVPADVRLLSKNAASSIYTATPVKPLTPGRWKVVSVIEGEREQQRQSETINVQNSLARFEVKHTLQASLVPVTFSAWADDSVGNAALSEYQSIRSQIKDFANPSNGLTKDRKTWDQLNNTIEGPKQKAVKQAKLRFVTLTGDASLHEFDSFQTQFLKPGTYFVTASAPGFELLPPVRVVVGCETEVEKFLRLKPQQTPGNQLAAMIRVDCPASEQQDNDSGQFSKPDQLIQKPFFSRVLRRNSRESFSVLEPSPSNISDPFKTSRAYRGKLSTAARFVSTTQTYEPRPEPNQNSIGGIAPVPESTPCTEVPTVRFRNTKSGAMIDANVLPIQPPESGNQSNSKWYWATAKQAVPDGQYFAEASVTSWPKAESNVKDTKKLDRIVFNLVLTPKASKPQPGMVGVSVVGVSSRTQEIQSIVGAKIVMRNDKTGELKTKLSDNQGYARFELLPGEWQLAVVADGYQTYRHSSAVKVYSRSSDTVDVNMGLLKERPQQVASLDVIVAVEKAMDSQTLEIPQVVALATSGSRVVTKRRITNLTALSESDSRSRQLHSQSQIPSRWQFFTGRLSLPTDDKTKVFAAARLKGYPDAKSDSRRLLAGTSTVIELVMPLDVETMIKPQLVVDIKTITGKPVANAKVFVWDRSAGQSRSDGKSFVSQANGVAKISLPKMARYDIVVEHEKMRPHSGRVVVNEAVKKENVRLFAAIDTKPPVVNPPPVQPTVNTDQQNRWLHLLLTEGWNDNQKANLYYGKLLETDPKGPLPEYAMCLVNIHQYFMQQRNGLLDATKRAAAAVDKPSNTYVWDRAAEAQLWLEMAPRPGQHSKVSNALLEQINALATEYRRRQPNKGSLRTSEYMGLIVGLINRSSSFTSSTDAASIKNSIEKQLSRPHLDAFRKGLARSKGDDQKRSREVAKAKRKIAEINAKLKNAKSSANDAIKGYDQQILAKRGQLNLKTNSVEQLLKKRKQEQSALQRLENAGQGDSEEGQTLASRILELGVRIRLAKKQVSGLQSELQRIIGLKSDASDAYNRLFAELNPKRKSLQQLIDQRKNEEPNVELLLDFPLEDRRQELLKTTGKSAPKSPFDDGEPVSNNSDTKPDDGFDDSPFEIDPDDDQDMFVGNENPVLDAGQDDWLGGNGNQPNDADSNVQPTIKNYYQQGLAQLKQRLLDQAETSFKQAISVGQNPSSSHFYIAEIYVDRTNQDARQGGRRVKKFVSSAWTHYTNCLRLDPKQQNPNHQKALRGRGYTGFMQEKYKSSASDFTKYLKSNPYDYDAAFKRALCYKRLDMPRQAIQGFTVAEGISNEDPGLYGHRAEIYFDLEEYQPAKVDLTRIISLTQNQPSLITIRAYAIRAEIHYRQGAFASCVKDSKKSISLCEALNFDPPSSRTQVEVVGYCYRMLSLGYMGLKQFEEAVSSLSYAIGINRRDQFALFNRGLSYCHLGKCDLATVDANALARLSSSRNQNVQELRRAIIDCQNQKIVQVVPPRIPLGNRPIVQGGGSGRRPTTPPAQPPTTPPVQPPLYPGGQGPIQQGIQQGQGQGQNGGVF